MQSTRLPPQWWRLWIRRFQPWWISSEQVCVSVNVHSSKCHDLLNDNVMTFWWYCDAAKANRDISFDGTDPMAEPREIPPVEPHRCPCGKPMVSSLVFPLDGLFAKTDFRRNNLTESQPSHILGSCGAALTRATVGQSKCLECMQRAEFEMGKYRMQDMVRFFYYSFFCNEQEFARWWKRIPNVLLSLIDIENT